MYHVGDGVDQFIPVDVYVAGCAARPEQMIEGVARALAVLELKSREIELPFRLKNPLYCRGEQTIRREMAAKVSDETN